MTETDTLSRPRRTQAERREESRRRMLDAALDLMAESRSLRFTLAEVGERAGYSRGLPSQVFQTKTALIEALVLHILSRSDAETLPTEERGEGMEAVLQTVRVLMMADSPNLKFQQAVAVLLVEASAPDSPYRPAVAELNQVVTGYLSKHLRIAAAKGEIRKDIDFRSRAVLLISAIRGSVLLWQIEPDRLSLETLWEELDRGLRASLTD